MNETAPPATPPPIPRKTLAWVNTTYFAEGLPFMIVRVLSGLFFTEIGVKERYLGYLNYLGLPWNLKFLWSPVIDGWGTKKGWQITLQALIGVLTCGVGVLSYLAAGAPDPSGYLQSIAIVFVVMAFLSATNDIAIDGYYLEAIPNRDEQALLSGWRVLAYRLAVVFARSGLVAVVALAAWYLGTGSPFEPWAVAFGAGGLVLILLALLHHFLLPQVKSSVEASPGQVSHLARARRVFWEGFTTYLKQPQIALILAFIIVYKMGDEIMFSMNTPFLRRELQISTEQYAWVGGIVGAAGAVLGAMAGGYWIRKRGLKRAIWPLTIIMNANIWLYVWLAVAKPDPTTLNGITIISTVHFVEQVAAGLGSAALLVFLLTTCSKEYKATHYAVGSAIMSIPGTFIGGYAGVLVEKYGYTNLYLLAFAAALPGMVLLPFVPIREADAAKA